VGIAALPPPLPLLLLLLLLVLLRLVLLRLLRRLERVMNEQGSRSGGNLAVVGSHGVAMPP